MSLKVLTSFVRRILARHPDDIVRVYVGTPLGAPTRAGILENYRRALFAVRMLTEEGYAAVAPHIQYCLVLEEQDPEQRAAGVHLDMALMAGFQKVILFTPDGTAQSLTSGMRLDLGRAQELGLPVEYRVFPQLPEGWAPSFLTPAGREEHRASEVREEAPVQSAARFRR